MTHHALLLLTFLSCLIRSVQGQSPAKQSLLLWYKQPANQWVEALPIGNGRLGGMVFGGVETDHIQFNEETLWTGGPRDYQREGAAQYLPQIRQLLTDGKQAEAEKLAQEKFMGRQSNEDDYVQKKTAWFERVRNVINTQQNPASATFDDHSWKTMTVPTVDGWEKAGLEGLDGVIWFRTTFDLPASWAGKDVVLDMGRIRDQDFTYLNGELVGSDEGITKNRRYKIPAAKLHVGKNQLAIQVINLFDKGGFIGVKTNQPTFVVYPEGGKPTDGVPLIQPFKYWIQDNSPPASPRYQADYQPFGDLWLNFKGQSNVANYRRELDLTTAISRVTYSANGVNFTREYLVSAPDQVMAIHLTASQSGKISFEALLDSPHRNFSVRNVDDQTIALAVQVRNGALRGESVLRIQTQKGQVSVSGNKLIVSGADVATLYVTAGTNFKNYKDVSGDPAVMSQQPLQTLRSKTFEAVKGAHVRDYQSYFNTLSLDLGRSPNEQLPTDERLKRFEQTSDPALAALYLQYGRYLLISSSRPGNQPANLQGIWNDLLTPPWGSKYTTNINLEMNYWPAEMLNLSACHEPMFTAIEEMVETGRKTAKAHYNARGWVLHHNTDLWRGTAPINASNHGIWVTGGAWVSRHLWEHYRYTQDRDFLQKRAYPIMKEAAQFFVDFLVKDPETGWLISTPSNSPEHGGLVAGPTMDHQIIRDLFKNCMGASEALNTDATFRDTLKTMYGQIAPNQIGKHGQLQEWIQDVDDPNDHHRHVSHLWGIHPGTDITWDETPDLMKAARQSLLERGDEGTGWSLAWKINFWARFRDGNHAFNMLKLLFRPAISPEGVTGGGSYPNLFDAHPPFQIDGNFGGSSGIAEMIVQSQGKTIDLLPALPSELPTGHINGICAQGGFVLNIRWQNGRLNGVDVTSKAGQPCVLRYGDKQVSLSTEKGKTYRLDGELKVL
ncbi:glycoside hydrolase N-terminal domain-containing protein [Spirosoma sp. BT702]|uniref:Glycoside hydrolase N-terminal domain-containing protein n=1 Tax=Spirosoma profusum TaxID=2771354 RepID=A0A926XZN0_9BACT|nr:glycoside hydrolase N-terminal domain-containing protein [Spirosoma profusum]MBD2703883.1 glycoside hydrolase N-terminal domain-containing protein [Spirosoma profusum]